MTRYRFRQALGGFFLAETAALHRFLPPALTPLAAHPGHTILAVTAFEFVESEVGAYGELVISVLVPPFAPAGAALPQAAFFPIALGTTTPASRTHARERWYLPEYDHCLDICFAGDEKNRRVVVTDGTTPVLTLCVARGKTTREARFYQCFSRREARLYRVNLHIAGDLNEHEEERGHLVLHAHPLVEGISRAITDMTPLREQSMDNGEQHFESLVEHGGA